MGTQLVNFLALKCGRRMLIGSFQLSASESHLMAVGHIDHTNRYDGGRHCACDRAENAVPNSDPGAARNPKSVAENIQISPRISPEVSKQPGRSIGSAFLMPGTFYAGPQAEAPPVSPQGAASALVESIEREE
ncbi:hypothetical protein [Arthrobacter sp. SO5]|uniref:hypothetical protein n=1 Tax=Arthrobacter sp. SO5 TaxID=1897055 RepID=UPI001E6095B4|nr:hypothetical protein [Arthrobacter sp. SO5]